MENELDIIDGSIRLDGDYDFIFQPGSVMAYSGAIRMGLPPLRDGTCWAASLKRTVSCSVMES